jgi:hypothetical protein
MCGERSESMCDVIGLPQWTWWWGEGQHPPFSPLSHPFMITERIRQSKTIQDKACRQSNGWESVWNETYLSLAEELSMKEDFIQKVVAGANQSFWLRYCPHLSHTHLLIWQSVLRAPLLRSPTLTPGSSLTSVSNTNLKRLSQFFRRKNAKIAVFALTRCQLVHSTVVNMMCDTSLLSCLLTTNAFSVTDRWTIHPLPSHTHTHRLVSIFFFVALFSNYLVHCHCLRYRQIRWICKWSKPLFY